MIKKVPIRYFDRWFRQHTKYVLPIVAKKWPAVKDFARRHNRVIRFYKKKNGLYCLDISKGHPLSFKKEKPIGAVPEKFVTSSFQLAIIRLHNAQH